MHNTFPTNILLNRIGIKQSEVCDFCNEKDFVEHMFVNCKRLGDFWEEIFKKISILLGKKIIFSEKTILLGIEQSNQKLGDSEIKLINKISIIGKISIIKNKMTKMNIKMIFEKELSLRNIIL